MESLGPYRALGFQSGDMPPTWQYDDAFAAFQPSHYTNGFIQFTAKSLPRRPLHAPRELPQSDMGLAFSCPSYQGHADLPSHTSNVLVNELSSWGYNAQPLQPALPSPAFGINPSVLVFPNDYSTRIDQEGAIAAAPFYDESQPLGNIHRPDLVSGAPGNTLLHGTAVGNDAHRLAGAMLHDGVGPGSPMFFPGTDDGTVEAVGDEMEWWLA
jgi:hypothetical protein